ncbi:glycoside hydrolase family 1 protein [Patescibacteria group bacterium]|nr:glycoside hydrolase family 1 protein [Patescibacteria group bacterium]
MSVINNKKEKARLKQVKESHDEAVLKFPPNFVWGSSTSSHQVEGNCINNDWWAWEQEGLADNHQVSGEAADHYNRYADDFKMAKDLNHNAHRLSIEWSRVEPEDNKWDEREIKHYRDVLKSAKDNNLQTFVTLHHFTNPMWFVNEGGWTSSDAPEIFQSYVLMMVKELGDLVDFWITINEPLVFASQGYISGVWPPQEKAPLKMRKVFRNMAKAHNLAYRSIHNILDTDKFEAKVGFANNVSSYQIYNKHSLVDLAFMQTIDSVWNHWFMRLTKGCNDFLGLNYYFHYRIAKAKFSHVQFFTDIRKERREASDVGWEIYPPGIFDVVMDMSKYKLPIYITENGIAVEKDNKRSRFIVSYVKELYHAIQAGAPVKGYFYWSLLDNWEWEKGYDARFGLINVDFKTQKRTIRESAHVYASIAKHNGIPHDLLKFVGHVTLGEITVKD